jgi:hypothetical protein
MSNRPLIRCVSFGDVNKHKHYTVSELFCQGREQTGVCAKWGSGVGRTQDNDGSHPVGTCRECPTRAALFNLFPEGRGIAIQRQKIYIRCLVPNLEAALEATVVAYIVCKLCCFWKQRLLQNE